MFSNPVVRLAKFLLSSILLGLQAPRRSFNLVMWRSRASTDLKDHPEKNDSKIAHPSMLLLKW